MKCPTCGSWNRDTFPRCYKCGTPLPQDRLIMPEEQASDLDEYIHRNNDPKNYIRVNDEGQETALNDTKDELALEMQNLSKRKESGREKQRSLRQSGASRGIAPTTRNIEFYNRRKPSGQSVPHNFRYSEEDVEGEIRPNARRVTSTLNQEGPYRDYYTMDVAQPQVYYSNIAGRHSDGPPEITLHLPRNRMRRRIVRSIVILLFLTAIGLSAYHLVYLPYINTAEEESLVSKVEITPSILGDSAAHTIKIPGEEGTIIYIKELHNPYTVTGGYATIEVPDYIWYENENAIIDEEVTATITPFLKTSAGEQVALEPFTYQVAVPASPLILVTPDTGYAEVSTKTYRIQFRVEKNSTVTINGEDLSDLVSTQDGLISYNANISPIGNNYFEIKTRCQYYRESTTTVVIYRAVQDIPLDLSETLDNRSTNENAIMTITATTLPGATITIQSPYENLDTSKLNTTGEFSFDAKFQVIGTNTITITASYPGKTPSVVNYDVYYVPPAKDYTRKAWGLDAWNYSELLSSISTRVATSQIYVCKGEIISIISSSPQLAIMETGDASSSRQVLLENRSTDTWAVGQSYRVYADVYGLYNGIPRLVGRYTYDP